MNDTRIHFRKNTRRKLIKASRLTVCSTMFCYNDAEVSDDPTRPPFCFRCQAKAKTGA